MSDDEIGQLPPTPTFEFQYVVQPPPLSDRLKQFLDISDDEDEDMSDTDEESLNKHLKQTKISDEVVAKLTQAPAIDDKRSNAVNFHPLIVLDNDDLIDLQDMEPETSVSFSYRAKNISSNNKDTETKEDSLTYGKPANIAALPVKEDKGQEKWNKVIEQRRAEVGEKRAKRKSSVSVQKKLILSETWEVDSASSTCRVCDEKFTVLRRRHHCRLCGRLVCKKCSSARLPVHTVKRGSFQVDKKSRVRVCNECVSKMVK